MFCEGLHLTLVGGEKRLSTFSDHDFFEILYFLETSQKEISWGVISLEIAIWFLEAVVTGLHFWNESALSTLLCLYCILYSEAVKHALFFSFTLKNVSLGFLGVVLYITCWQIYWLGTPQLRITAACFRWSWRYQASARWLKTGGHYLPFHKSFT